jgi:hypothetical protein
MIIMIKMIIIMNLKGEAAGAQFGARQCGQRFGSLLGGADGRP